MQGYQWGQSLGISGILKRQREIRDSLVSGQQNGRTPRKVQRIEGGNFGLGGGEAPHQIKKKD